ncbi:MAG: nitrous oxide reductase accessory protein NosL, partial [Ferruginibacter sp.]|nr:nitrous oxide reductase accessory protein NosL [Ferruginibacter sp.]
NRRGWLNLAFALFVIFGIVAMVDFWRWEYDYGHDLSPNAAIVVPGMAYQPPLIGFKQLLNFGAYSIPDIGGFIFIGVGILLLFSVFTEWKKNKSQKLKMNRGKLAALIGLIFILPGCSAKPEPIVAGTDACSFCKMTISDKRFGAEAITKKGKIYKFDDIHCMLAFLKSDEITRVGVGSVYFTDFSAPHSLVNADHSFLLRESSLKGPMNGDIISFSNKDSLLNAAQVFQGTEVKWSDVSK